MALQFALLTRELDERDYAALAALDDLPGSAGAGSRRGLSQDAVRRGSETLSFRSVSAYQCMKSVFERAAVALACFGATSM